MQALLRGAIDQLTPQQRTAFILHREEGLSYQEIAERMDVAVNTARKHLHNALEQVRAYVRAHAPEGLQAAILLCINFL